MSYHLPDTGFVLAVDKPYGWTSFQVVNYFKWRLKRWCGLKKVKIGHAGTLDPLATGILILCVGKETKNIHQYQVGDKRYRGSLRLGMYSPSYDLEKRPISLPVKHYLPAMINERMADLEGQYEQIAPMFSAKKHKGKRAFELARKGQEVVLKRNVVSIDRFFATAIQAPCIDFEMHCSKGTYVRSTVRDFGLSLNTQALMTALRRVKSGDFELEQAHSLEHWDEALRHKLIKE